MQNVFKTALAVAAIAFLASCGSTTDHENKGIAAKKTQLEKMKTEQRALSEKITALEEDIIKLDPSQKKENAKLVAIAPLETGNFTHYIDLQGRVDAINVAYVAPRGQGGLVKAIYVKQGDQVKKGQLLLRLDDAMAQKQLDQLNVQLAYAKDILQRQQNLWNERIGTEVQLLSAKNNVESIEKQIATAKEQSSFSNVYAEMAGVAETVNIKVGEFFQGGTQIRIVNTNDLKIVTQVPENYIEKVGVGSTILVNFPEAGDKIITTRVSVAGRLIDPNSRSFYVEAKLPVNKSLRPNQIALVKIQDYTAKDVITIPVNTLQNDDKGKFVMMAVKENDKWIAHKTPVVIGQLYGDKVEVQSGLKAGDQLITDGFQGLYEGQTLITN
ncbi:efflux RND transporter periplasmic adaptor subunit [Agriterribacter sp.]|uniref:efflux RND transporter periplasmic adaptor subunit n=1 Tax=Agriterribacter sp. TaxID=2821509 RepID=UPI002C295ED1|nr:efflux RND transporter periplasmic adaptor subunit [Agriterribacter sp.]HRO46544.1 efflux RND transporter periplasmic adaptor subunit [Agriterribacter sp.]HRQ19005.1 efflux RND transporter periplasmic adaptor subunit [Agriterribacter sp.]